MKNVGTKLGKSKEDDSILRINHTGLQLCKDKCTENQEKIMELRNKLEKRREKKNREDPVEVALKEIEAEKAEEKEKRSRRTVRNYGKKQYEKMTPGKKEEIDTWKGFRGSGSGSSGTSAARPTGTGADTGTGTDTEHSGSKKKMMVFRLRKKREETPSQP